MGHPADLANVAQGSGSHSLSYQQDRFVCATRPSDNLPDILVTHSVETETGITQKDGPPAHPQPAQTIPLSQWPHAGMRPSADFDSHSDASGILKTLIERIFTPTGSWRARFKLFQKLSEWIFFVSKTGHIQAITFFVSHFFVTLFWNKGRLKIQLSVLTVPEVRHSIRESQFLIWKSKLTACTIDSAYSGKDNVLQSSDNLTEVSCTKFPFFGRGITAIWLPSQGSRCSQLVAHAMLDRVASVAISHLGACVATQFKANH
jgi:hypothetical protein